MENPEEFRIAEILARKSAGSLTQNEQRTLDLWIARSEENRRTYERFISGESLLIRNRMFGDLDPGTTIAGVRDKYIAYESRRRRKAIFRRSAAAAAVVIAAAFASLFLVTGNHETETGGQIFAERSSPTLILDDGTEIKLDDAAGENILLGGVAAIVFDNDTPAYEIADEEVFIGYNTISVPQGNVYRIRLPDGSVAVINACSKLKYPIPFPKNIREVWLEGEAYFEVEPNAEKPFAVNYKNNSVLVLGTKFNIRAYPGKGSVAALTEGSILCRTSRDSCLLTPGHQAVIAENSTGISVEKADMRTVLAWTRDCFSFDEQPLGAIMQELGEWYGVEVKFGSPGVEHRIFTIEANRSSSINSILDILVETGKIRYVQEGRKLTVHDND